MHAVSLFTLPFIRLSRTHLYIGLRQLTRSLPFSPLGDKNTDGCTEHLRLCYCQVQITELALLRRCVSVYPHTHTRTHHRHTEAQTEVHACMHTHVTFPLPPSITPAFLRSEKTPVTSSTLKDKEWLAVGKGHGSPKDCPFPGSSLSLEVSNCDID